MTQNGSQSSLKRCTSCHQWFDRATFPLKSARCKECHLARARELSRRPDQVQKRKKRRSNFTEQQKEAERERGRRKYANRTPEQEQRDYERRQSRREVDNARTRKLRAESPERRARQRASTWKSKLKHKFGITPEIYDAMHRDQGGRCYFCEKPGPNRGRGGLVIDHDKETGFVRGLLCRTCNSNSIDEYKRLPRDRKNFSRANDYLLRGNGEYVEHIRQRLLSAKPDHELFAELRNQIFGNRTLPGNSADLIREARQIRDAEIDRWG